MASDLYILDNNSIFSDPFSLFSIDLDPSILQTSFDETNSYTNQMESLSISPFLSNFEVKTEDNQLSRSSDFSYSSYNDGSENVTKFMQRSCSSNNYSFNPSFDALTESANFQTQICKNGYSNVGQMRRVCSTGDLQNMKAMPMERRHQLGTQSSYIEDASTIKVGRYSSEERKERILRYKAKRTQRNFNKTIKYACRKTLADNRPRIRGRFARHDEPEDTSKTVIMSSSYEDEYDLWIDSINTEEEEGIPGEGSLFSILGPAQFKYFGY